MRDSRTVIGQTVVMSVIPDQVNEYRCDVCDFVYRPSNYDGVDLAEQPEGFQCPDCQSTKGHFQIDTQSDDQVEDEVGDAPDGDEAAEAVVAQEELKPASGGDRRVHTKESNPSVSTLQELHKDGDLDPQPPYQRYEVWNARKRSKLIESALMNLSLPRLYFAENDDEKQEVVDGQQRLQAFFRFLNNEYPLSGLTTLSELNGKKFNDLEKKLRTRLKQFGLSVVVILKESHSDLRYDLFERLNTGATGLNEQELRNAVFRGKYNDFVYRLADLEDWRKLHNLDGRHKRMADAEWVLRYMAFRDQTYHNFPEGSVAGFLNRQMKNNRPSVAADCDKAEDDFKQATSLVRTVFGDKAFRKFTAGEEANVDGSWESKRVLALADVQLWGMNQHDKGAMVGKADQIYEAALELLVDPTFQELVTSNTSGKTRVKRRFKMWDDMLDAVMEDSAQGPRIFPRAIKQALWDEGHTCARCQQQVKTFDDAHVDHKTPYSQGGKTEKENGQLMHRFCNMSKGQGA